MTQSTSKFYDFNESTLLLLSNTRARKSDFRSLSSHDPPLTLLKNLSPKPCGLSRVEWDERVKRFSHFYRIRVQLTNAGISRANETQQQQIRVAVNFEGLRLSSINEKKIIIEISGSSLHLLHVSDTFELSHNAPESSTRCRNGINTKFCDFERRQTNSRIMKTEVRKCSQNLQETTKVNIIL